VLARTEKNLQAQDCKENRKGQLKDYLVRLAHKENPSRVIICARFESLDLLSTVRALDQHGVTCNRLSSQAIIVDQAIIKEREDAAPTDRATTHKHGVDTCELVQGLGIRVEN
jgi:hypothetical protein